MSLASRIEIIPTLPDLDPSEKYGTDRAIGRSDVVAAAHPVLSMLQDTLRRNISADIADRVFPTVSAATARDAIRAHLPSTPLAAFSETVLDDIATAFAAGWFPQTYRA